MLNSGREALFKALKYVPHDGQMQAHALMEDKRFVTVVCGRRFGKTKLATYEVIYQALQADDQSGAPVCYVISDTYQHAGKIFNELTRIFQRELKPFLENIQRKDRVIELKSGAQIYAKSADSPASLAGDGVTFAVVDESGFVDDYAIEVLLPSLIDRKGKLLAIGTPDRSDTWFKRHFDLGLGDQEDYGSLQLPTSSNTSISFLAEEIEKERARMNEEAFRKYYLAEFLDLDENPLARFLHFAEIHKQPQGAMHGRRYVAGVDLADRSDYTYVLIVDVTETPYRIVKTERWRGTGYEATGKRIAELLRRYNNAVAYVDRTGVGDAAMPHITRHYGNIYPVVFTQKEKMNMFDTVSTYLERKELELLDANNLIEEMRVLRATQTARGITYAAPPGQKDDGVMALFLAGKGFKTDYFIPKGLGLGGFRAAI